MSRNSARISTTFLSGMERIWLMVMVRMSRMKLATVSASSSRNTLLLEATCSPAYTHSSTLNKDMVVIMGSYLICTTEPSSLWMRMALMPTKCIVQMVTPPKHNDMRRRANLFDRNLPRLSFVMRRYCS